ncbi:LuxR C-terminal-related transcriptional regulator [Streptomyces sp. NPDC051636]|uniref:LuxR C-terminal-related transcriptional regulator n=1 Tax=Streptomyces sp. NPDC051636 TaxID=3365663 RepID=UPI00379AA114
MLTAQADGTARTEEPAETERTEGTGRPGQTEESGEPGRTGGTMAHGPARPGAELLRMAAEGLHREASAAASLLRLLPPDDVEATLLRARALVLAGRPEAALRAYASLPAVVRDTPVRAAALRLLGRWEQAERCLEGCAPPVRARATPESVHEWVAECAALALDRGEPVLRRTAQRWAQEALRTAPSAVATAHARCLLAAVHAAAGLFGAALDSADAAARELDGLGEDALLRRLDAVPLLADALFHTGRRHAAERRLEEALVLARESGQEQLAGRLELGLARARLAAEDLAAAGRWAERAAGSAHRAGGVPLAVAAALCLARVRLAADDSTAALEAARRAVRAARPLGGVWRDRAEARLREVRLVQEHEVPAPPPEAEPEGAGRLSLEALSRREAQVAVLVSEGCTNQQIAARLQVSPKTVETHLSRIFKKLGITSRAQVAHWVGLGAGPVRDGGG